jgi:hypothetical protein
VARPERSYYRPTHAANHCANRGPGSSATDISMGLPRCRADTRTHSRSRCSANEGVAETMPILHEFDAANVLPLDLQRP